MVSEEENITIGNSKVKANQPENRLFNTSMLLFSIALLLSFWLYWDGLAEAVLRWQLQEEYSHGYIIPLVLLFILWERRFQIAASYRGYSWWGLLIICVALTILLVGEISALYVLIHYSFILLLLAYRSPFWARPLAIPGCPLHCSVLLCHCLILLRSC